MVADGPVQKTCAADSINPCQPLTGFSLAEPHGLPSDGCHSIHTALIACTETRATFSRKTQ